MPGWGDCTEHPKNIRNVALVGQLASGKTSLADCFAAAGGLISEDVPPASHVTNTRADETRLGMSFRSVGLSLTFRAVDLPPEILRLTETDGSAEFGLSLLDTPGHVDFLAETSCALRTVDGAVVVLDPFEGMSPQTETILQLLVHERIKPTLVFSKIDRAILEMENEELYLRLVQQLEKVKVLFQTLDWMGNNLDVFNGSVVFMCCHQNWGFNLQFFGQHFCRTFGIDIHKMTNRLWGDHFFHPTTREWKKQLNKEEDLGFQRGFCAFVVEPLRTVLQHALSSRIAPLQSLLKTFRCEVPEELLDERGASLARAAMHEWLPAKPVLLSMVAQHLPSPAKAQPYRTEVLYSGALEDPLARGMRECNPNAGCVLFISKLIPQPGGHRFFCLGRVFSGTVCCSQKVRVIGPQFTAGSKEDEFFTTVDMVFGPMPQHHLGMYSIQAGNIVLLTGLDLVIAKFATVTDPSESAMTPLRGLFFREEVVLRQYIECKNAEDQKLLLDGLKRLSKSDPLVKVVREESGVHAILGSGELHLKACLRDLEEVFLSGPEIAVTDEAFVFQESVSGHSDRSCISFSPNRQNRLQIQASSLDPSLVSDLHHGALGSTQNLGKVCAELVNKYPDDWNEEDAGRIWAFGPHPGGANLLHEGFRTEHAQQYSAEIRACVVPGFHWATREGPLADELCRGIQFLCADAVVSTIDARRGPSQLRPAARRVIHGSILTASPVLCMPIYELAVLCSEDVVGGMRGVIEKREGVILQQTKEPGGQVRLNAHIPAQFGLMDDLTSHSAGQAVSQARFQEWQLCLLNPLLPGKLNTLVLETRKKKGMSPSPADSSRYVD